MDIKEIKKKIENRSPDFLGLEKRSAVLLPLIYRGKNQMEMLFQVRAEHLSVQPGEISFPGGKSEQGETLYQTAVRETIEELGVRENDIQIFGQLDYLITPFNLMIVPFVGGLKKNIDMLSINKDEVNHIFTVPLDFFKTTSPQVYTMKVRPQPVEGFPYNLIPSGEAYPFREGEYPSYFYLYNNYVIWGFTARLIKHFVDICCN